MYRKLLIFFVGLAIPPHHSKIFDYAIPRNIQSQLELRQLAQDQLSDLTIDDGRNDVIKIFVASYFPTAIATNISQQCIDDSQAYVHGFLRLENWALQMYESSAKFPEGWFGSSNPSAVGLFDECLSIHPPNLNFQGQYCTVFFKPVYFDKIELEEAGFRQERLNWLTIYGLIGWWFNNDSALIEPKIFDTDPYPYVYPSVGFCIPSSCSPSDFRSAVAQQVGVFPMENFSIATAADEKYCFTESNDPIDFDGRDIAFLVILSCLGCLIAFATFRETWKLIQMQQPIDSENDGLTVHVLHCFSIVSNGRKLLSTKIASENVSLGCLNGIRFLSATWVVMGHTWYQATFQPTYSRSVLLKDGYKWTVQGIASGTLAVDTFFLLSGLLVSYILNRELDHRKGHINILKLYLHRYLRLTPVYLFIIGFIATLLVYVSSGPYWYEVHHMSIGCRNAWWMQILYVNNLVPRQDDEICMGETWYLACDMQMFLVSPFLIYPLWRWKKLGVIWLSLVLIASIAGIIAVYILYDLPPTSMLTRPTSLTIEFYLNYYCVPWTRSPPFLVGIFLGWVLHITKNQPMKLTWPLVTIAWILSITIGLSVVYGLIPYLNETDMPEINSFVRIAYGSLNRLAWSTAVGWVIFASTHGYGGFVNSLLSWKGFIPLSRLTYVMYLVHLNYMAVYYARARKPIYYTTWDTVQAYFGFLLAVMVLAFVICLTVEIPFLNLEKLFFGYTKRKSNVKIEMTREIKEAHHASCMQMGSYKNNAFIMDGHNQTQEEN